MGASDGVGNHAPGYPVFPARINRLNDMTGNGGANRYRSCIFAALDIAYLQPHASCPLVG
jgi:hypothetical protein